MTCRTGTTLVLLLSLCGAPVAGAAAAVSGVSVDATDETPTGNAAFLAEVGAALQQADGGDSLGASIVLDRLLVDPRMAKLDVAERSNVWASAAMVAGAQKQDDLALQRLRQAVAINPHNAYARLRLAWTQMVDEQPDDAADNVILALADSDGEPDMSAEMVGHLDVLLKDKPAKRLAVLQGLFDHHWKIDGVEPVEVWTELAILQVEAGQRDKVAATLERIDAPAPLMRLRADKRFDRYLRRDDPRYDPVAASRRHIDRLRVDAMLSPGLNETAVELSNALMVAGDLEEVVGMTARLAEASREAPSPPPELSRPIGWMLDTRSRAFRRLGKTDEAVEAQLLAVRMTDPQGDTVSHRLNLAGLYAALHRPLMAREAMKGLGDLSTYGQSGRALIDLQIALQLNDAVAATRAREQLFASRVDTPGHYRDGLLLENRMDDAAAVMIAQLADPMDRSTALLELQDTRDAPPLPEEVLLTARWKQLKQRPDVQAAVRRVGRVESYPLFTY
jgi:tetratricopeptide (TPR) repeat protein